MNTLVNRIATGQATLLGVEDICTRLGVSRTTFDRWVRNGGKGSGTTKIGSLLAASQIGNDQPTLTRMMDSAENQTEGMITFPPPDIRIGNSPKWEIETFKNWLKANIKTDVK